MKKKKTIILMLAVAAFGAINLMKPFQNAFADPCNPWDSGWNFITGEYDPDYDDELAVEGDECQTRYYDMVFGYYWEGNGTYPTTCTWAVAGTCTPVPCE